MADNQDSAINDYLTILETKGLKITDRAGMLDWFNGKVAKGFPLDEIKKMLEDKNYDFKTVDQLLEEKSSNKEVMKKVEALETKIESEEQTKKKQSQLNLIVSAFMTAIVSAGSSWFIGKQVVDIDTSVMGEAGGFLSSFIKGGWILAIVAAFVGLLLLVMYLSQKYKDKSLLQKK